MEHTNLLPTFVLIELLKDSILNFIARARQTDRQTERERERERERDRSPT